MTINGTKFTTLEKNKSNWEKSGSSFRHYTYSCPNNFNPWDIFEYNALDNDKKLWHMNKRERNAYLDAKKTGITKRYFERSAGITTYKNV